MPSLQQYTKPKSRPILIQKIELSYFEQTSKVPLSTSLSVQVFSVYVQCAQHLTIVYTHTHTHTH